MLKHMRSRRESLVALIARIRLDALVVPQVALQVRVLGELLVALIEWTSELLHLVMRAHVFLKRTVLIKSLATQRAFVEVLLVSVSPLVTFK